MSISVKNQRALIVSNFAHEKFCSWATLLLINLAREQYHLLKDKPIWISLAIHFKTCVRVCMCAHTRLCVKSSSSKVSRVAQVSKWRSICARYHPHEGADKQGVRERWAVRCARSLTAYLVGWRRSKLTHWRWRWRWWWIVLVIE